MTARYIIGNALDVVRSLPPRSIHAVITSPPYLAKRDYLPADDPAKALEMGQEDSPADFLAGLLLLTGALWDVLRDDGTLWVNLGDTASGSGGAGGDYNEGGFRESQPKFIGSARRTGVDRKRLRGEGWPLAKSVCWLPSLYGASLAYGRNLLTGEPCRQWVTRPPITWCKPNPPVGEVIDKCREATELFVFAAKNNKPGGYYFDLDAIRESAPPENERKTWNQRGPKQRAAEAAGKATSGRERFTQRTVNPNGKPPNDWWVVASDPYPGAHFATFPPELIIRPVIAACPPGGTILDCFGGSGTTAAVAAGHGRNAILIDLDARNAHLARERCGMFLTIEGDEDPRPIQTQEAL